MKEAEAKGHLVVDSPPAADVENLVAVLRALIHLLALGNCWGIPNPKP